MYSPSPTTLISTAYTGLLPYYEFVPATAVYRYVVAAVRQGVLWPHLHTSECTKYGSDIAWQQDASSFYAQLSTAGPVTGPAHAYSSSHRGVCPGGRRRAGIGL